MRIQITNMASVGIIFRASNPKEIFIEMKDDGHPIKLVRRQLCLIGGNWIGEKAREDNCPLDTFRREVEEELCLEEKPIRTTKELVQLGLTDREKSYQVATTIFKKAVAKDCMQLQNIKRIIMTSAVPFGDFLNTVSKKAMDKADPANSRGDFTTLVSYWSVPLSEKNWKTLHYLQDKFGNLSNESVTMVTSLTKVIDQGLKIAFGHDQVLQRFFIAMGFKEAKKILIVDNDNILSIPVGTSLSSYNDYFGRYEISKRPI